MPRRLRAMSESSGAISQSRPSPDPLSCSAIELSLIDQLPVPVYTTDKEGRITLLNRAAAQLWGEADLLGERLGSGSWELCYSDGRPMPYEESPLAICLATGCSARSQLVMRDQNGHEAYLISSPTPILDQEGVVTGAIDILIDTSDQLQVGNSLRVYREIFDKSTDAIAVFDRDGRFVEMNPAHELLSQYSSTELIGEEPTKLISTASSDQIMEALEERKSFFGEQKGIRKDGSEIDVEISTFSIDGPAGEPEHYVSLSRDITARKVADEALRQETKALETIQRIGQSLNSTLDLQTLVQSLTDQSTDLVGAEFGSFFYNDINPEGEIYQLYSLSGVPRSAFENFPQPRPTPIFGPTFRNEATVRCDDVTQDERYGKWGPHFGMPKGHLPVCSYLAVSVVSQSGEVIGGLFYGHSSPGVFTERHERLIEGIAAQAAIAIDNARLYGKLQALNADLESRVRQRTADLQAANLEMEGFTYTISHDLRGPLRAIAATSSMLMQDHGSDLDSDAFALLRRQKEAAIRMGELIDDLLKLSRLARQDLVLQETDLSSVAGSSADQITQEHGGALSIVIQEGMRAKGDAKLLRFVFDNLLGNSVKFARRGETPKIEVGLVEGSDSTFFVRDNGIGFDLAYTKKIFLPFERLVRDHEYPGTGIGLANVKRIIDRHRGEIWCDSTPGVGTTFFFRLPS